MKIVIFTILLAHSISTECTTGCLKCDEENKCLFCDVNRKYKLEKDECVIFELDNCKFPDIKGDCLECNPFYYSSLSTKKCIFIDNSDQIDECRVYSNKNSCKMCQENYFLRSNKCILVDQEIPNCLFYKNNTECMQCRDNYILSKNSKECQENAGETYCASYSLITCRECIDTYYLNKELTYKRKLKFESENQRQIAQNWIQLITLQNPNNKFNEVCELIELLNCEEEENGQKCLKCEQGYFLDENQICQEFPLEGILNCREYTNENSCKECENGFFLQSSQQCEVVQTIQDCITYDGASSTSACSECSSGFYSSGTRCEERNQSVSIINCLDLDKKSDKCEECNSGRIISNDGLKCFASVPNCELHANTSSSSDQVTCTDCKSGFYLINNQSCEIGQIGNCDQYRNSPTICSKCQNQYYLLNNKCEQHIVQPNCEEYSLNEKDTCKNCEGNYFNFKVLSTCIVNQPIVNCKEYDTSIPLTCSECELGFYKQQNLCVNIPSPNCATYDGDECSSCDANYAITQNEEFKQICDEPFSFTESNCDLLNINEELNEFEIDEVECQRCQAFSYPFNYTNHYVCVRNDQMKSLGFDDDDIVQNCVKYNVDQDCIQCDEGLFLNDNEECVKVCPEEAYRLIQYVSQGNNSNFNVNIIGNNQCVQDPDIGVEIYGLNLNGLSDLLDTIVKCKDNFLPMLSIAEFDYHNQRHDNSPSELVEQVGEVIPGIQECREVNQQFAELDNCEYYQERTVDREQVARCIKCEHGYSSVIAKEKLTSSSSSTTYNILDCQKNSDCSSEKYYGLDIVWSKFFSCHKCNNKDQIPFLAIRMQESDEPIPSSYRQYGLTDINRIATSTINTDLSNIECLEDTADSLGYDTDNQSQLDRYQELPKDCALGVINLSVTNGESTGNRSPISDNEDSSSMAHFCAACKPGYKGTPLNSLYSFIKVKCDKIPDCNGDEWFNSCSQCSLNHTFLYENERIDFSQCVENDTKNCYAGSSNGVCMACKKGYNLNLDNNCEQITPSNCQSSDDFVFLKDYKLGNFPYAVYHDSRGVGCSKCRNGFQAVEMNGNADPFICTQSEYLQQESNRLPNTTNYIPFCEKYGIDDETVICQECIGQYVVNQNRDICYNGPQFCDISDGPTICLRCEENKYLVNNQCQSVSLSFCKTPNSEETATQPQCKECEEGYFLNSDFNCELGEVSNCKEYVKFSNSQCMKCFDGFALFQGFEDYCYKINESLKCKDANIRSNNVYGGEIDCTQCNNNHDLVSSQIQDIPNPTKCFQFEDIQFCKVYDKKSDLASSTFKCLECQEQYFSVSGTSCNQRTFNSSLCDVYDLDKDRCKECSSTSFLNLRGECLTKPQGIPQCLLYSELNTCERCRKDHYLSNNICLKVPNEKIVNGCEFYQDENSCEQCQKNYFLQGNSCELGVARNCKTFSSANQCETCEKGFFLKTESNQINCQFINQPNCGEFVEDSQECLQCNTNFYVDSNGNCVLASPLISKCLIYESNSICSICQQNYVLSDNKEQCLNINSFSSNFDGNCSDYIEEVDCTSCEPGYYFKDDECVSCETNGCFYCQKETPDVCELCLSEYYMNKEKECIFTDTTPGIVLKQNLLYVLSIFLFLI